MAISDAERQRKHREKRRGLNLVLVHVWVPQDRILEIRSIAVRMTKEGSQDKEPIQRQLNFAQFLFNKKGLKISPDVLSSSKKLSEWLNKNKRKEDKKRQDKTRENERLPCP
jgi:hypothetical protein